jgi:hypothetical protein
MWMETHWVGRGGIVGLGIAAIDIAPIQKNYLDFI